MTTGPLTGVTVVSLEQAVAAPLATRQLADLGARVIKVERPGDGDFARGYDRTVYGQASYFVWLNRGKESIALDIKAPDDRAVLDALIDRADILVQNLAPGALERIGLDLVALTARRQRLITCSISGYGRGGPYASRKAYDLLVQCEAGLLSVTGTADEPAKVGISVADIATGMYAHSGLLAALYERERTGRGSRIDVAMLDALGEWMSQPYLYAAYGGTPPPRTGARHASISPYGPFRTGDGGTVFVGVQNDREWALLCRQVLGRPDLVDDPRFATNPARVAHDNEVRPLIEQALSTMDADRAGELLEATGIANARLRGLDDFARHPQLAARDRWRDVDTPGGPVRSLLPPVTVDGREAPMGPVPAIGQHTAAIRAELGFDAGSRRRRDESPDLTAWVGRTESRTGMLGAGLGSELRCVLGLSESTDPPYGVHWLLFDQFGPADQIGPDGHPRRGGFLPPIELPRRMWAGGRLEFLDPLPAGERLTRTSRIVSVTPKAGRHGPLMFVTVEHLVESANGVHVREEQDLVYMDITPAGPRRTDADEANRAAGQTLTVRPDEVMLFRYSALTHNGHRIHYDADYARTVELYPGLVIHGPLTATLLLALAARCADGRPVRRFEFRGRAPLINGDTLVLKADRVSATELRLAACTAEGLVGMTATAEL